MASFSPEMPAGWKKVGAVMPLGDRDAVLEACRLDQISARPRLYIIDGDYDFILGKGVARMKYLYRCPATNLEAFVLLTRGLVPFIHAMNPEIDETVIEADLQAHLEVKWLPPLRRVFAFYAENQRLNLGVVTSDFHVIRLAATPAGLWEPDTAKIADRVLEIATAVRTNGHVGSTMVRDHRKRIRKLPIEKVVSGKTYLFPLVENFVRNRGCYPGSSEKLMLSIIQSGKRPCATLSRRIREQLT